MSVTDTLIVIVAAAVKNHGIAIGKQNPWRLAKDLAYFHRVTTTVTGESKPPSWQQAPGSSIGSGEGGSPDEKLGHPASSPSPAGVPVMNACILGRKTWEALPKRFRPLKGRYNIVITSDPQLFGKHDETPEYTVTQPSIQAALEFVEQMNAAALSADTAAPMASVGQQRAYIDRVFITGGGGIYNEALNMNDRHLQVLITYVQLHDEEKCNACDAFFPQMDNNRFSLQPHSRLEEVVSFAVPSGPQVEGGIEYEFLLYEKNREADAGERAGE
ncbi:dihydrofolate reductase [Coemansia sp. RSA 1804]|nr:dihydrofolate reductase [Coemansia sp. RSA 1804]